MRILELSRQIKALQHQIAGVAGNSAIAGRLASIPGYGAISSAELAGEIGTIERFRSEASLALYLGMAPLDNSSGKLRGSKAPKHVNARAKAARSGRPRSPSQKSPAIPSVLRKEARRRQETQPSHPRPKGPWGPPPLPRHLQDAHRRPPLMDRTPIKKSETF